MSEEKVKKEKKPKSKAAKIVEWVLTGVFSILFLFALAGFIDGAVHKKENFGETLRFGWATFVVRTDSMEPRYPVKSAIITYKESLAKVTKDFNNGKTIDISFYDYCQIVVTPTDTSLNDQTTLHDPKKMVMTHRIREIRVNENVEYGKGRYTIIVAGINPGGQQQANQYQAFNETYYLGVVKLGSTFLGGIFGFISSIWGLLILLLIPTCYIVIASVLDIFKAFKEDEESQVVATQGADGTEVVDSSSRLSSLDAKQREKLKQELLQEMMEKRQKEKAIAAEKAKEDKKDA